VKVKKRTFSEFSFAEGCSKAMNVYSEDSKKVKQCYQHSKSYNHEPVRINLSQSDAIKASIYAFIHSDAASSLSKQIEDNQCFSAQLSFCSEQTIATANDQPSSFNDINNNANKNNTENNIKSLQLAVRNSPFSSLLQVLGPFQEFNGELENKLNYDVRLLPTLLQEIPPLFIGSIVYSGHMGILISICEVYGRSADLDVHMETSGDSIPSPLSPRRYPGLTINIIKQADGGKRVSKLILGTDSFNVLCTATIIIFPEKSVIVNVDPALDRYTSSVNLTKSQLFLIQSRIQKFND
jgi:hypothetical protein